MDGGEVGTGALSQPAETANNTRALSGGRDLASGLGAVATRATWWSLRMVKVLFHVAPGQLACRMVPEAPIDGDVCAVVVYVTEDGRS